MVAVSGRSRWRSLGTQVGLFLRWSVLMTDGGRSTDAWLLGGNDIRVEWSVLSRILGWQWRSLRAPSMAAGPIPSPWVMSHWHIDMIWRVPRSLGLCGRPSGSAPSLAITLPSYGSSTGPILVSPGLFGSGSGLLDCLLRGLGQQPRLRASWFFI